MSRSDTPSPQEIEAVATALGGWCVIAGRDTAAVVRNGFIVERLPNLIAAERRMLDLKAQAAIAALDLARKING